MKSPLPIIFTITLWLPRVCSFSIVSSSSQKYVSPKETKTCPLMASTTADIEVIDKLKAQIQSEISTTERGLSASEKQKGDVDDLIQKLEANCPLSEPARSSLMGGKWIVDYTTAPPPSNGKLGPFVGYARQIIDLDEGTYVNYLSVPGDIKKEWLSAKLEATFSEWDGAFLVESSDGVDDEIARDDMDEDEERDENNTANKLDFFASIQSMISGKSPSESTKIAKPDYGAYSWKVDFQTLTIRLFGIPLVTKKFENTSRIWKMSFLDEQTRVGKDSDLCYVCASCCYSELSQLPIHEKSQKVRAGRTGKDEDNMVFYMSREQD